MDGTENGAIFQLNFRLFFFLTSEINKRSPSNSVEVGNGGEAYVFLSP